MEYIVWIAIGFIVLLALIAIIAVAAGKHNNGDTTSIDYRPECREKEYYPFPTQPNDKPILSTHARERMSQRLGIYSSQQEEIMNRAYKFWRTTNNINGDLKASMKILLLQSIIMVQFSFFQKKTMCGKQYINMIQIIM